MRWQSTARYRGPRNRAAEARRRWRRHGRRGCTTHRVTAGRDCAPGGGLRHNWLLADARSPGAHRFVLGSCLCERVQRAHAAVPGTAAVPGHAVHHPPVAGQGAQAMVHGRRWLWWRRWQRRGVFWCLLCFGVAVWLWWWEGVVPYRRRPLRGDRPLRGWRPSLASVNGRQFNALRGAVGGGLGVAWMVNSRPFRRIPPRQTLRSDAPARRRGAPATAPVLPTSVARGRHN